MTWNYEEARRRGEARLEQLRIADKEREAERELARRVVDIGYKLLAKEHGRTRVTRIRRRLKQAVALWW